MGFLSGLGRLFGMEKGKGQMDYQGEKPVRLSETEWGKQAWGGKGGITDAMQRIGTGYTPEMMDKNKSAWSTYAQDYLKNVATPQINSSASARGLGRSSLPTAQIARSGTELSMDLAKRAAELERMSQDREIQQQMQGRQLGSGMAEADVQSQLARANFERGIADRQQAYRDLQEQNELAGVGRLVGLGSSALGASIGGLMDGGQGALAGLQLGAGLGSLDPATAIAGAQGAAKTYGIGGYAPTAMFASPGTLGEGKTTLGGDDQYAGMTDEEIIMDIIRKSQAGK